MGGERESFGGSSVIKGVWIGRWIDNGPFPFGGSLRPSAGLQCGNSRSLDVLFQLQGILPC